MFLNENNDYLEGSNEFAGKYTGEVEEAFEICLESEREWHQLEMKMARAEHSAIVNEDAPLMEAAVGDFFAKAKQWFITLGKKIKEFFKRLVERIGVFFMNAKKFVAKYGKQLEALGNNEIKGTVKMFPNIKDGKATESPSKITIMGKFARDGETLDDDAIRTKTGIQTSEQISETILGGTKADETLTSSIVKTSLTILRSETKFTSDLKSALTETEKGVKEGIKRCEDAAKSLSATGNEAAKTKTHVANLQKAVSLANAALGQMGGAYSKLASNALSVCKSAWNSRKGENIKQKGYDESASILDQF